MGVQRADRSARGYHARLLPGGLGVNDQVPDAGGEDKAGPGWLRDLLKSSYFARLTDSLGNWVLAPVIGLIAGALLLFGGLFLGLAWQFGVQPIVDAHRYAPYTASAQGRIVESWAAIEFDPAELPRDKLYWQAVSHVSRCVRVEYATGPNATLLQRGYCGMRLGFSADFRLHDWSEVLQEGIPFTFARDASGFEVQEVRIDKRTLDWISTHPPNDTFMLSTPAPETALAALREQFNWPVEIAALSWTTAVPSFPLRHDPIHPELAMPERVVVDSSRWSPWGLLIAVILGVPGFRIWRVGIGMFLEGKVPPRVIWIITLGSMIGLPWWSHAMPTLLRHVNANWAAISQGMIDDVTRTTRVIAAAPGELPLEHGERLLWRMGEGEYAQTFGRIQFRQPTPMPRTPEAVLAALREQATTQVRAMPAAEQAVLFRTLSENASNDRKRDLDVFTHAAEAIERDAGGDAAAQAAARHFLLFAVGYNVWDVDAMEAARSAPSKD